jgi:hypothetical protein
MYVARNQRLQEFRAGLRPTEEEVPGTSGLGNPLYPDVRQEFAVEEAPTAPGRTESEASGSYANQTLGHP